MASFYPSATLRQPGLQGLGQQLREMFQEMVSGPMPEHLMTIVEQLEAQAVPAAPETEPGPAIRA